MNWRNSVTSPNGYKYFLQIFHSSSDFTSYVNPPWFDSSRMGNIFLMYVNGVLTVVGTSGPETLTSWIKNLGYPVVTGPVSTHTLTFSCSEYGTISGTANGVAITSPAVVSDGAQIVLTASPNPGYTAINWQGLPESATIEGNVARFTMPSDDTRVTVMFVPVVTQVTLTFEGVEHGTVDGYVNSIQVTSPAQVEPGATIMLIVGAESGYTIREWVGIPSGAVVSGNVATFTMPNKNVSVSVEFSVIPVTVNNLCVIYEYEQTTTHLAFVRDSTLDRYREGVFMYAWTIATTQWTIIYTDTLDCALDTQIWVYDASTETWSISDATIEDPIWTTKVSFVIENHATVVGRQQITVDVDQHTYSNAEESFLAFRCNPTVDAVITILVEHDWVWEDTGAMQTPRTVSVDSFGNCLVINNS